MWLHPLTEKQCLMAFAMLLDMFILKLECMLGNKDIQVFIVLLYYFILFSDDLQI